MTTYDTIYDLVRQIPFGRVTTYGTIAEYLDLRGGARQVGWAMNSCFGVQPPVPAHRVVNRLGRLSGRLHFATPTLMQELLENEGIIIVDDSIQNFDAVRWYPA